jgi:hypothetical protein
MKKIILISISSLFVGFGCSHFHQVEGRQESSMIPAGVRVKIGSSEVAEGENVQIYKKKCIKQQNKGQGESCAEVCSTVNIGKAKVLKILTKDTAIVNPDAGITMDTEMYVEKLNN